MPVANRYEHINPARSSGHLMKRSGHRNFNAIYHNRSRPLVLFLNWTWLSSGQISSVLLQTLHFALSKGKFGWHGRLPVTFWQLENNTEDHTWLWDTALNFFGQAFSLRHQITWGRFLKGGINYTRHNSYSRDKSAILGITIPGIKMGSRKHYYFILGIAIPGVSLLL